MSATRMVPFTVVAALAVSVAGVLVTRPRHDAPPAEQPVAMLLRQRHAQHRADVENAARAVDQRARPAMPATPAPAVRRWSAAALEDALRLGSRVVVLDVGDARRCRRAHLPGAQCLLPAQVQNGTAVVPRGAEVVVMGDGLQDDNDDAAVNTAATALVQRGVPDVGILVGGMRAWRSDARTFVGTERAAPGSIRGVSPADLQALRAAGPLHLLDVRGVRAFEAGHLPGARNVPVTQLLGGLRQLPAGGTVVIIAADDGAALDAARVAADGPERPVVFLAGGMRGAALAGMAVEPGQGAVASAWQGGAP